MSGKDAKGGTEQRTESGRSRAVLAWAGGIGAVAALTFAMNYHGRSGEATAQNPASAVPRATTKSPSTTRTANPTGGAPATRPVQPAAATSSAQPNGKAASVPGKSGNGTAGRPGVTNPDLKVVALVNSEQITRQDLARECVRRYGKEVLESMVNKHLILQACQQQGVTITEQDVEDEIERIAKKFNLTTERWLLLLQEERNIAAPEYRREIIWPTLALRTLATEQIKVSEDEIQKAFESEYGPKVQARLISVGKREKAEDVYRKVLANPSQFNNLAKDYSEDASASVMGLIPPIRRHVGEEVLEQAAFRLKPGEISPIIQVANQYVILKCESQIEGTFLGGERLKVVRAQLADRVRDQKMRSASGELFRQLQQDAKVVNVLNDEKLQSQHPGVAALINNQPITMRQLSEECIQRHGLTVLDGEINRLILQQELKRRQATVNDADIEAEVARAAEAYGYQKKDGTPDIERWLKHVTENDGGSVEMYVRDAVWPSAALKKLVGKSAQVTDEDIKKGFESNYGERVEVMAIVLGNQRQAQQVWEMARDNPTDNFFGELAHQYSIEPASRANFGKVPPLRRYGGQPLVEEQAFQLKPGELSSIIGMGDKFIILRCLGRTKPYVQELSDEVRQELVRDIEEKKLRVSMSKEFDRLKETTPVDNFLAGTSVSGKRSLPKNTAPTGAAPAGGKSTSGTSPNPGKVVPAGATGPLKAPAAAAPSKGKPTQR